MMIIRSCNQFNFELRSRIINIKNALSYIPTITNLRSKFLRGVFAVVSLGKSNTSTIRSKLTARRITSWLSDNLMNSTSNLSFYSNNNCVNE